jgi:hypothetical protein
MFMMLTDPRAQLLSSRIHLLLADTPLFFLLPLAEYLQEMADGEDIQPLVCDNGTGMVKVRSCIP